MTPIGRVIVTDVAKGGSDECIFGGDEHGRFTDFSELCGYKVGISMSVHT